MTVAKLKREARVVGRDQKLISKWNNERGLGSVARVLATLLVFSELMAFSTNAAGTQVSEITGVSEVDFRRDVLPVLSTNCFQCHGPDEEGRAADLRLDDPTAASETLVAGSADDSQLIDRIESTDADLVMPPPESGRELSAEAVAMLRRWVDQGAEYQKHWAFEPPVRPTVELVSGTENPIDVLVRRKQRAVGLEAAPPASREQWLRRLSLDLTGLPPMPKQTRAFVSDENSDAEHQQIERMLASPQFGERWARVWLDAAHYADSDGYGKDKPRPMWKYRDWVINALNADMPYDQFIIHQLAGDLIDDRNQASIVATGFLRNSMSPHEGGALPEDFRNKAMFERMDVIGKSILGLTLQCAQCHTHKYDPLTHEEYYSLFAFINNTHDAVVPVYDPDERKAIKRIEKNVSELETKQGWGSKTVAALVDDWEQTRIASTKWQVLDPDELPFEVTKYRELPDHSILSEGYSPKRLDTGFSFATDVASIRSIRLELLTHSDLPRGGPGRSVRGTAAISEFKAFIAPINDPENRTEIKWESAWSDVNPAHGFQPEYLPWKRPHKRTTKDLRVTGPIEYAIDGDESTAWTTDIDPGRRNQNCVAIFRLAEPVGYAGGSIVTMVPVMAHGGWNNHDNHNCLIGRFRFSVSGDAAEHPLAAGINAILSKARNQRTLEEQKKLWRFVRSETVARDGVDREIENQWQQYPEGTSQFVLKEIVDGRRETHVLTRGEFLSPSHAVKPSVPSFLHPLPENADGSRLTLARWLVDRRSPTTARSIVNRIWQSYFGNGLVGVPDDFGTQATPSAHPELLDFLAVELMDHGWRLKPIHRLIVSSQTYRQSSIGSAKSLEIDPDNQWLSRGPRMRADAEMIHDIALAASGLLVDRVGGEPVFPPVPPSLLKPPVTYAIQQWPESKNPDRYRRAIYTFRFRGTPYPLFETFDAPPGQVSCVRRVTSNTPTQALVLMNRPLMMESAAALAELCLQHGDSDREKLSWGMERCISRIPNSDEIDILLAMLDRQRERLAAKEIVARKILPTIWDGGGLRRDVFSNGKPVGLNERAAWTLVTRAMIGLNETMTKP